ncbi:MAG: hypothetical protein JSU69_01835 [Candidatus Zixiibacteriota bacterium]|nr:MAG: hypothetical protein JSU69_01835 [candidate division Zixibacteria bacterium]
MTKMLRLSVFCVLVAVVSLTGVRAQTDDFRKTTSLGLDAGLFLPLGQWTEHRINPAVSQFQKGPVIGFDIERRFWKFMGLAVNMGYVGLNTGDWEDYASSQGDFVEASAYMLYLGFHFRPYLLSRDRDYLKAEIGFNFFGSQSQETFGPYTYDYDFLKPHAGFVLGLEYDRFLSENVAIAMRAVAMFIAPGINYATGKDHIMNIFPLTVGIRFHA